MREIYKAVLSYVLSLDEISGEADDILGVLREQLGLTGADHETLAQEVSNQLGKKKNGAKSTSAKSVKIRNYIHVGQSAYRREDYQQALKYFNEALKVKPNHREALFFKKQCLIKLGDEAPPEGKELVEDIKELEGDGKESGLSVPSKSPYSTAAKELLEPLCSTCGDTGECRWCKGKGICVWCKGSGKCRACNGTGKDGSEDCPRCKGTGKCNTCKGKGKCIKCNGVANCQVCNI